MCSNFCQASMDNYQGDLADIVHASAPVITTTDAATTSVTTSAKDDNQMMATSWQFGSSSDLYPFPDDPLLRGGLDEIITTGTGLPFLEAGPTVFSRTVQISQDRDNNNNNTNTNSDNNINNSRSSNNSGSSSNALASSSPSVIKRAYGMMSCELMDINGTSSGSSSHKDGFLDCTAAAGVQIPSPRNPGIKRRKSQAKKVVCIPAPAAANSRQSGEVVPSDLWAWRKYGQKPIKGSPYPRGYYRCSSSKGCSARKQVERSRTDPNMLVITYTSEHNHPWPTQRNALAGSTRSQPSKTTSSSKTETTNEGDTNNKNDSIKETSHENNDNNDDNPNIGGRSSSTTLSMVKGEELRIDLKTENEKEESNNHGVNGDDNQHHLVVQGYRPMMPEFKQQSEDFFADLVEFEGGGDDDPLNLLFTQNKALDPFGGLFDWGPPNNNNNNSTTTTTNIKNDDSKHMSGDVERDS